MRYTLLNWLKREKPELTSFASKPSSYKREMAEGGEVEMGMESSSVKRELFPEGGSSVDKPQLSLLLKICKANGKSLPYGVVNDQLVLELFQNTVGQLPSQILVLNDQDVLVEFPLGTEIYEMAHADHGPAKFRDVDIYIGCIMAMRDLLISAEPEREELRMQRDDLEWEREELEERHVKIRQSLRKRKKQQKPNMIPITKKWTLSTRK